VSFLRSKRTSENERILRSPSIRSREEKDWILKAIRVCSQKTIISAGMGGTGRTFVDQRDSEKVLENVTIKNEKKKKSNDPTRTPHGKEEKGNENKKKKIKPKNPQTWKTA